MKRYRLGLAIHGGAGSFPKDKTKIAKIRNLLKEISSAGYTFLKNHSSLETVLYAAALLEDAPEFNAGTGSKLQRDGRARMSASIMDGKTQSFAGIVNIENVKNPIQIARCLLHEKDRVLAADGAEQFAREKGFPIYNPITPTSLKTWRLSRGKTNVLVSEDTTETVGAVAMDSNGNLAAATSTGGKGLERAGRVSDSATPCGNFANAYAAVSTTGIGEDILDEALASKIAFSVEKGDSIREAFSRAFRGLRRRKRAIGAIGMDRFGRMAFETTTEILYYSFKGERRAGSF